MGTTLDLGVTKYCSGCSGTGPPDKTVIKLQDYLKLVGVGPAGSP